MFKWLALAAAVAPDVEVTDAFGLPISELKCSHHITTTDMHPASPANVTFHQTTVELSFDDELQVARTRYIYVDGKKIALITGKGAFRMVVPLSQLPHHKVVTGDTNSAGFAYTAASVCQ
jgi:hypothetical protein